MNNVTAFNDLEMIAPPGEAGGQPQTPGTGKPEVVKDLFRGEGKKWKISHPGLELFRKRVYILRLTLL